MEDGKQSTTSSISTSSPSDQTVQLNSNFILNSEFHKSLFIYDRESEPLFSKLYHEYGINLVGSDVDDGELLNNAIYVHNHDELEGVFEQIDKQQKSTNSGKLEHLICVLSINKENDTAEKLLHLLVSHENNLKSLKIALLNNCKCSFNDDPKANTKCHEGCCIAKKYYKVWSALFELLDSEEKIKHLNHLTLAGLYQYKTSDELVLSYFSVDLNRKEFHRISPFFLGKRQNANSLFAKQFNECSALKKKFSKIIQQKGYKVALAKPKALTNLTYFYKVADYSFIRFQKQQHLKQVESILTKCPNLVKLSLDSEICYKDSVFNLLSKMSNLTELCLFNIGQLDKLVWCVSKDDDSSKDDEPKDDDSEAGNGLMKKLSSQIMKGKHKLSHLSELFSNDDDDWKEFLRKNDYYSFAGSGIMKKLKSKFTKRKIIFYNLSDDCSKVVDRIEIPWQNDDDESTKSLKQKPLPPPQPFKSITKLTMCLQHPKTPNRFNGSIKQFFPNVRTIIQNNIQLEPDSSPEFAYEYRDFQDYKPFVFKLNLNDKKSIIYHKLSDLFSVFPQEKLSFEEEKYMNNVMRSATNDDCDEAMEEMGNKDRAHDEHEANKIVTFELSQVDRDLFGSQVRVTNVLQNSDNLKIHFQCNVLNEDERQISLKASELFTKMNKLSNLDSIQVLQIACPFDYFDTLQPNNEDLQPLQNVTSLHIEFTNIPTNSYSPVPAPKLAQQLGPLFPNLKILKFDNLRLLPHDYFYHSQQDLDWFRALPVYFPKIEEIFLLKQLHDQEEEVEPKILYKAVDENCMEMRNRYQIIDLADQDVNDEKGKVNLRHVIRVWQRVSV